MILFCLSLLGYAADQPASNIVSSSAATGAGIAAWFVCTTTVGPLNVIPGFNYPCAALGAWTAAEVKGHFKN